MMDICLLQKTILKTFFFMFIQDDMLLLGWQSGSGLLCFLGAEI